MAYNGFAWPGLNLSIKAVSAQRAKYARWIKTGEENPRAYINHKRAMTKYRAALADLDTGLKVLRDAQRSVEAPKRRKTARKISAEPTAV